MLEKVEQSILMIIEVLYSLSFHSVTAHLLFNPNYHQFNYISNGIRSLQQSLCLLFDFAAGYIYRFPGLTLQLNDLSVLWMHFWVIPWVQLQTLRECIACRRAFVFEIGLFLLLLSG